LNNRQSTCEKGGCIFCSDYFLSQKIPGGVHWALSLLVCFWVVVSLCTEKENLTRILSTGISEIICAMQNVFKIFSVQIKLHALLSSGLLCICQSNIFLCLEFSFGGWHGGGWKGDQSVSQQQTTNLSSILELSVE
jgi:hypothetical protein